MSHSLGFSKDFFALRKSINFSGRICHGMRDRSSKCILGGDKTRNSAEGKKRCSNRKLHFEQ